MLNVRQRELGRAWRKTLLYYWADTELQGRVPNVHKSADRALDRYVQGEFRLHILICIFYDFSKCACAIEIVIWEQRRTEISVAICVT